MSSTESNLKVSKRFHGAWETNKRSQGRVHTCRAQWDGSYDVSYGVEGYSLFRKKGRRHKEEVLSSVSAASWSAWSSTGDEELTKSLWIRTKGKAGTDDIVMGIATGCPIKKTEQLRPLMDK